jgi:hypothetical protein
MKDFARGPGRLRQLPFLARLTYSIFITFTLVALAGSAWLGADMLGTDLAKLDEYYAGAPSPAPTATPTAVPSDGPNIDLPADMPQSPAPDPIPLRKLLEVTHFHLFSMPVYLMILSHLFMLSRWGPRAKLGWIVAATLSVVAHLVAPWVARSGGAGARAFYAGSGLALGLSFAVMSAVPLIEMWSPNKRIQQAATKSKP